MALIGTYYLIEPKDWLFATHGDVQEAKRRAELWFSNNGTYDGAEQEIENTVLIFSAQFMNVPKSLQISGILRLNLKNPFSMWIFHLSMLLQG